MAGTDSDYNDLYTSEYFDFEEAEWKQGPDLKLNHESFCVLDLGTIENFMNVYVCLIYGCPGNGSYALVGGYEAWNDIEIVDTLTMTSYVQDAIMQDYRMDINCVELPNPDGFRAIIPGGKDISINSLRSTEFYDGSFTEKGKNED